MEISFTDKAKDDLEFWRKTGNHSVKNKISALIDAIISEPHAGLGKPEPLKYELAGAWSRRINKEHRIVYEIKNNKVIILSLRGHY